MPHMFPARRADNEEVAHHPGLRGVAYLHNAADLDVDDLFELATTEGTCCRGVRPARVRRGRPCLDPPAARRRPGIQPARHRLAGRPAPAEQGRVLLLVALTSRPRLESPTSKSRYGSGPRRTRRGRAKSPTPSAASVSF